MLKNLKKLIIDCENEKSIRQFLENEHEVCWGLLRSAS